MDWYRFNPGLIPSQGAGIFSSMPYTCGFHVVRGARGLYIGLNE